MFHHTMNHMVPGVGPGSRGTVMEGRMAMGENQANMPMRMEANVPMDPYKVPGYPQTTGMHAMMSKEQITEVTSNPRTRGMSPQWYMAVMGLMTVVRVLPPDIYDKVISGKGELMPGASVPGAYVRPRGRNGSLTAIANGAWASFPDGRRERAAWEASDRRP